MSNDSVGVKVITKFIIVNFMPIHSLKSVIVTSWWNYRKSQRITKVSRFRHLGTINVCTKLNCYPFISC